MELASTLGISRLDYESTPKGWLVRYTREGETFTKGFSDGVYGSAESAREAAQEYYDELRTLFPPPTYREHLDIHKPASGVHGVRRATNTKKKKNGNTYSYDVWIARWFLRGKNTTRTFSISKHGDEEAKRMAVEVRKAVEPELEEEYYEKYWNYQSGHRFNRADIVEEPFAFEGAEKFVLHRAAERDPRIRILKLRAFLKEHGKLFCEVCGFNFEGTYGQIGRGLIEVHHLVPLSQMEPDHKTTIDELMCICSNCHFAVHNGDADKNLKSLRILFSDATRTNKVEQDVADQRPAAVESKPE